MEKQLQTLRGKAANVVRGTAGGMALRGWRVGMNRQRRWGLGFREEHGLLC